VHNIINVVTKIILRTEKNNEEKTSE